jgi:hypothetical protein
MAVRERFSRHDVEDHKRAIFKAREDFFAADRSTMGNCFSQFNLHNSFLGLEPSLPQHRNRNAPWVLEFEWF